VTSYIPICVTFFELLNCNCREYEARRWLKSWRRGAASRKKQENLCAQIAVHNALKRSVRSWVRRSLTVWVDLTDETARLVRARRMRKSWSEWRDTAAQMSGSRAKDEQLERSLQAISKTALLSRKAFYWKMWLKRCYTIRSGEKVKSLRRKWILTERFSAWISVTDIRSRGHQVKRMQDNIACRDRLHSWTRKVSQPSSSILCLLSHSLPLFAPFKQHCITELTHRSSYLILSDLRCRIDRCYEECSRTKHASQSLGFRRSES
jgi:hypothetical protein